MYLFLSLKWWQSSILWSVLCRFHSLYHCSHLLSLVAIRCRSFSLIFTLCHSLYHLLSLVVTRCHSLSLVIPLIVTRCHSLSLVVPLVLTRCHSLSLVVPLVVTCCYSLSLVVIRCHSLYHSLSLVVIRCHSLYLSLSLVAPVKISGKSFFPFLHSTLQKYLNGYFAMKLPFVTCKKEYNKPVPKQAK